MISDEMTIEEITKHTFQVIEIDAYAYTQKKIKEYLNIKTVHPNSLYQSIIDEYSKKYLN